MPLSDAQLAAIQAAFRSLIPGIRDDSTVMVTVEERDVHGLRNSWNGPVSILAVRISDRLRADRTEPTACACWPAYEHSEHCPIYQAAYPAETED